MREAVARAARAILSAPDVAMVPWARDFEVTT